MPQARRKHTKKTKKRAARVSGSGLGMLLSGIIIGSVATSLFLGWKQDPKHGIGSGINQMIEKSRQSGSGQTDPAQSQSGGQTQPSPNYDFYTILPEIEQVIPEEYVPPAPKPAPKASAKSASEKSEQDHYILQVGSFGQSGEADQLKARLALSGYESYIQKVTVDGKRFYRVRMGPFRNLEKLDKASTDLSGKGIEAMRIKVSSG